MHTSLLNADSRRELKRKQLGQAMTTYYFIIYPADYPDNSQFDHALVRLHELSPKAAEKRREEIEHEINGGYLWKIEDAVNKTGRRKVVLMPYSHAREYTDFGKWPCNKEGKRTDLVK